MWRQSPSSSEILIGTNIGTNAPISTIDVTVPTGTDFITNLQVGEIVAKKEMKMMFDLLEKQIIRVELLLYLILFHHILIVMNCN